jgi:cytochrome b6-f complex iron-sulfur subunit
METTQPSTVAGEESVKPVSKPASTTAPQAKSAKPPKEPAASETSLETTKDPSWVETLKSRRRFVWTFVIGFVSAHFLMFLRFFFPRTLFEPSPVFRVGFPSDFNLGVDERFKEAYRVWVVRQPDKLFVIYARCTHLGCTPNWNESEKKFKCPCHGSGYDIEGINFEGPAPRPLDRAHLELDPQGQIVVNTSKLYACPPGASCGFETDGSFLHV